MLLVDAEAGDWCGCEPDDDDDEGGGGGCSGVDALGIDDEEAGGAVRTDERAAPHRLDRVGGGACCASRGRGIVATRCSSVR